METTAGVTWADFRFDDLSWVRCSYLHVFLAAAIDIHVKRRTGADPGDDEIERRPRFQRHSQPPVQTEKFDEKAVLEQDRALIEQLTQRAARERPKLKRPKTPPKVTPYRPLSSGDTAPPSPAGFVDPATPEAPCLPAPEPESSEVAVDRGPSISEAVPPPAVEMNAEGIESAAAAAEFDWHSAKPEPVVPRTGGLFTASDIDSLMGRISGAPDERERLVAQAAPDRGMGGYESNFTHNSEDISKEFYAQASWRPQPTPPQPPPPQPPRARRAEDVQVPDRSALREQIRAIDSWLEDDIHAREKLEEGGRPTLRPSPPQMSLQEAMESSKNAPAAREAELFGKLEAAKKRFKAGEFVPAVEMKDLATRLKPLLPGFTLEQLIRTMGLFCSVRYEDHDFYLHILGEIPVQIRGITPQMLTKCLSILRKLRLNE
ncbi:HERC2, partial [Symbiodinium pilosum]